MLIKVTDSGTGIPPEHLDKIFDPFFTTKQIGQGTGLGLSTVVGIVKSHAGFIEVQSQMGKGTQFRIFLPALKTKEISTPGPAQTASHRGAGELILVVDDEASIRVIASKLLPRHGYQVLVASDGFEATRLCASHRSEIKAAIVDLWMPLMDGAATIRELAKIDPTLPIIVSTGSLETGSQISKDCPTVRAFIPKPWQPDRLLLTLFQIMRVP